jgi:hypothetical protein
MIFYCLRKFGYEREMHVYAVERTDYKSFTIWLETQKTYNYPEMVEVPSSCILKIYGRLFSAGEVKKWPVKK